MARWIRLKFKETCFVEFYCIPPTNIFIETRNEIEIEETY